MHSRAKVLIFDCQKGYLLIQNVPSSLCCVMRHDLHITSLCYALCEDPVVMIQYYDAYV